MSVGLPRAGEGLTSARAAALLAEHGPNQAPQPPRKSLVRRVVDQLRDPMILLLLAALVVVVLLGDTADGIIIAAVVVLNTAIGVFQEVRAESAIAALNRLSAPQATVFRDGSPVVIDAAMVVPGDLVRLEAGDVVPADATLVEAVALQVDESAMTGESVPVSRGRDEEVLSGTVVTAGRGLAAVVRTGADSGLGRIAALIAATGHRPTPLQRRLSRLSRQLVLVTLGLAGVVFLLGLARGDDAVETLILAVSLAVAAIPESLPAVVSVALALGAYRMAGRAALVRWLPAVETLGSVSVLASDKTGTLTEGRMVVQRLWTPDGAVEVTGRGYGVAGELVGDPAALAAVPRLIRDLALCNDARLSGPHEGEWGIVGDPMEAALLVAGAKAGQSLAMLRAGWRRVDEVPFDSETQRMTSLEAGSDGRWLAVCKGAPERVLALVAPDAVAEAARQQAQAWAAQGFRVLAVADVEQERRPAPNALETGLTLVGLAAISDPARPGAREVVAACRDAGITTVLITGDHPATAYAVADAVGITAQSPEVADGAEVARGEHADRVERVGVYARTKPEQKVDIVTAWQRRGHVVAMTGDGVNDAPALRGADIGVAMGERGTEVARQAADLVLADDNLRTVVVAVGEGRRIHTNIRLFLRYGLSGGFAEVAVILLAPFLGIAAPLAPGQILWINMLTHGIPGVAFGGEPLDPAVMRRPSPSPERSVLGAGLLRQILVAGAMIAVVSLVAGLYADAHGAHVQSWVFLTLALAQLGVGVAIRSPRTGLAWRSRGLELAIAVAVGLQLLAVWLSPLQDLLGTETVSGGGLLLVLGLSTLPGALVAAGRGLARRWPARPAG